MTDMGPLKVLQIEDDPGDATLVERALAYVAGSVQCHTVTTLGEALERLEEERFDAVLLDLSLPDGHGLDAVSLLRKQNPETPIVILTGHVDNRLALKSLDRGVQDFVVKGQISGEQLERSLRYAIQRHAIQSENERLVSELEKLARYDSLTGVLNRNSLAVEMSREWNRSCRSRSALCCVLLDIDFFKKVNDTYGHSAGDKVLASVAEVLRESCRLSDCVARYGGEEFCILLPETREENALIWAERARRAISKRTLMLDGGENISVTASFGVAERLNDTGNPEELVNLADQALLVAKQLGRNQVVAFGDLTPVGEDDEGKGGDVFGSTLAGEVMMPLVCHLENGAPLSQAAELLLQTRVDSIPVLDADGQLIGLVAEEDLTSQLLTTVAWRGTVGESINRKTVCFPHDVPVRVVCEFLSRAAVRRIVVTQDGRPVGIISRNTLLRWFRNARLASGDHPPAMRGTASSPIEQSRQQSLLETLDEQIDEVRKWIREGHGLSPGLINASTRLHELIDDALARCQHWGEEPAPFESATCGEILT